MRYAIVTETWPPEVNGVALTVHGLAEGLRQRGHRVTVVRPRQQHGQPAQPHERLMPGLPVPRYPGLRVGLPAGRRLALLWQQQRPDAVYIATEGPLGWSALRTARRMGIPVATGFHTRFDHYMRDYVWPRPLAAALERVALRWMRGFHNQAQATLVPTHELHAELVALGFARPARLPRAVDTRLFDPRLRDEALRADWGLGPGALAVIHVGRIAPEKNLPLAVEAFRAIQARHPEARFVWVGDGPGRDALQRAHPDFIFRGIRRGEDLARHFASADLFLFPSRSETYGNVTLEAMASGVPTVAFDYGAARECLRDAHGAAVAGQHASRAADDAFVAAAVRIAGDAALRTRMGMAARDAVSALRPAQVAADFDTLLHRLAREATALGQPQPAAPLARQ